MLFSEHLILIRIFFPIILYWVFKQNGNLKLSKGEKINIQAGSLSSKKAIIPFGYNKLEICNSHLDNKIYTLGELLTGDELFNTNYFAILGEDEFCKSICSNQFKESTINSIK